MPKRKEFSYMMSFLICILLLVAPTFALSVEQASSYRQSMRSYTSEDVSEQQLLDVLWAAYGHTNGRRNVPKMGGDYSLIVYVVNETGSYRYVPESNSFAVHSLSVDKESIAPYVDSWTVSASAVFVLTWDETKESNHYFAAAEAGCVAQNVYLAAASEGLGTCLVGMIDSDPLGNVLQLPSTVTPLFVMPLGDPTDEYVDATPKYSIMTNNLPTVQYSPLSFEETIGNIGFAQQWSADPLSVQLQSQLLWAAYGYSTTDHVTVPSAYGVYPLEVYVSNATGIYHYTPESHSVTQVVSGDRRSNIANTFSGKAWAADAPELFLIAYNTAYSGDGGFLSHLFSQADSGCVVQQLFLEAAAWNLEADIISDASEVWGGTEAQALRSIMGASSAIIPLHVVPVGIPEDTDNTPPVIGVPAQNPVVSSVEYDQTVTVTVEVTDGGSGVSGVVLSYSTNGGTTWTDTAMLHTSGDNYSGEIPGFTENKSVQYKIVAYDNNDNSAVEDNLGNYYSYNVIPELQNFLIMMLGISAVSAFILMKRKNL